MHLLFREGRTHRYRPYYFIITYLNNLTNKQITWPLRTIMTPFTPYSLPIFYFISTSHQRRKALRLHNSQLTAQLFTVHYSLLTLHSSPFHFYVAHTGLTLLLYHCNPRRYHWAEICRPFRAEMQNSQYLTPNR